MTFAQSSPRSPRRSGGGLGPMSEKLPTLDWKALGAQSPAPEHQGQEKGIGGAGCYKHLLCLMRCEEMPDHPPVTCSAQCTIQQMKSHQNCPDQA